MEDKNLRIAPGVKSTVYPDERISFNEFHLNIRKQLSIKLKTRKNEKVLFQQGTTDVRTC